MRLLVCLGLLVSVVGCSPTSVMSVKDRVGLGAYIAYNIVVSEKVIPDNTPDLKPGDTCPECNGRGRQGDGTIEFPCDACKGTGKVQRVASKAVAIEDQRVSAWPKRALADSNHTVTTTEATSTPTSNKINVIRRSTTRWTVGTKRSYTTDELASHLLKEHGIDTTGYNRQEMEAMHDNIHNGYTAYGKIKSDCPDGSCPTR